MIAHLPVNKVSTPADIDFAYGPLVSAEELAPILRAHADFAAGISGGRRALFASRDLSGVDLSYCNLSEADFTGALLARANLQSARFTRASLHCCDMRRVDARCCDFTDADMRGVILTGSNLSHAKLNRTDFRAGRTMKMASGRPVFTDRGGEANSVDFSNASLCSASFDGARLDHANFSGAIIQGTTFKGARLKHAEFKGAVLCDVNLDELNLPPAVLKTCTLAPSPAAKSARPLQLVKLYQHQLWVKSGGLEGTSAVFDGEDLRPISDVLAKHKLTAISAKRAIGIALDFSGLELQGANFEDADLRGANFECADLRGVRFRGAKLEHAKFMGADIGCLTLRSGQKLECDFFGAEVTDEQLEAAVRS